MPKASKVSGKASSSKATSSKAAPAKAAPFPNKSALAKATSSSSQKATLPKDYGDEFDDFIPRNDASQSSGPIKLNVSRLGGMSSRPSNDSITGGGFYDFEMKTPGGQERGVDMIIGSPSMPKVTTSMRSRAKAASKDKVSKKKETAGESSVSNAISKGKKDSLPMPKDGSEKPIDVDDLRIPPSQLDLPADLDVDDYMMSADMQNMILAQAFARRNSFLKSMAENDGETGNSPGSSRKGANSPKGPKSPDNDRGKSSPDSKSPDNGFPGVAKSPNAYLPGGAKANRKVSDANGKKKKYIRNGDFSKADDDFDRNTAYSSKLYDTNSMLGIRIPPENLDSKYQPLDNSNTPVQFSTRCGTTTGSGKPGSGLLDNKQSSLGRGDERIKTSSYKCPNKFDETVDRYGVSPAHYGLKRPRSSSECAQGAFQRFQPFENETPKTRPREESLVELENIYPLPLRPLSNPNPEPDSPLVFMDISIGRSSGAGGAGAGASGAIIGGRTFSSGTLSQNGEEYENYYRGRLLIDLYRNIVPRTCENFRGLCTGEYGLGTHGCGLHYLDSSFHNIQVGSFAQGGDFILDNGCGIESIYGKTFEDENFTLKHEPWCLSMCNTPGVPDSNGCQFFICFDFMPELDGKNVVFGRLKEESVAVAMQMLLVASHTGTPTKPVKIEMCGQLA